MEYIVRIIRKISSQVRSRQASLLYARLFPVISPLFLMFFMGSCSVTRHLSEDKFLLTKNEVGSADGQLRKEIKDWRSTQIIQKPNTKWFSFLSVPLGIYSLAGNDTTTWAGRVLRGIGQAPAVFDSVKSIRSCEHLLASMKRSGTCAAAWSSIL